MLAARETTREGIIHLHVSLMLGTEKYLMNAADYHTRLVAWRTRLEYLRVRNKRRTTSENDIVFYVQIYMISLLGTG